jgi:hypothetical protein
MAAKGLKKEVAKRMAVIKKNELEKAISNVKFFKDNQENKALIERLLSSFNAGGDKTVEALNEFFIRSLEKRSLENINLLIDFMEINSEKLGLPWEGVFKGGHPAGEKAINIVNGMTDPYKDIKNPKQFHAEIKTILSKLIKKLEGDVEKINDSKLLILTAWFGDKENFEKLVKKEGIDLNARINRNETALNAAHALAYFSDHEDIKNIGEGIFKSLLQIKEVEHYFEDTISSVIAKTTVVNLDTTIKLLEDWGDEVDKATFIHPINVSNFTKHEEWFKIAANRDKLINSINNCFEEAQHITIFKLLNDTENKDDLKDVMDSYKGIAIVMGYEDVIDAWQQRMDKALDIRDKLAPYKQALSKDDVKNLLDHKGMGLENLLDLSQKVRSDYRYAELIQDEKLKNILKHDIEASEKTLFARVHKFLKNFVPEIIMNAFVEKIDKTGVNDAVKELTTQLHNAENPKIGELNVEEQAQSTKRSVDKPKSNKVESLQKERTESAKSVI